MINNTIDAPALCAARLMAARLPHQPGCRRDRRRRDHSRRGTRPRPIHTISTCTPAPAKSARSPTWFRSLSKSASVAVGSLVDMRHGECHAARRAAHSSMAARRLRGSLWRCAGHHRGGGLTELILRDRLQAAPPVGARAATTNSPTAPRQHLWGRRAPTASSPHPRLSASPRARSRLGTSRTAATAPLTRVTKGSVPESSDLRLRRSVIVRARRAATSPRRAPEAWSPRP